MPETGMQCVMSCRSGKISRMASYRALKTLILPQDIAGRHKLTAGHGIFLDNLCHRLYGPDLRTLFQWVKAEKSKSVVSPLSYWVFSLAGSYLFCLYGWLRDDFSIILGQFISYYIYLWNLDNKKILKRLHPVIRIILVGTPVVAAAFMLKDIPAFVDNFFFNEEEY